MRGFASWSRGVIGVLIGGLAGLGMTLGLPVPDAAASATAAAVTHSVPEYWNAVAVGAGERSVRVVVTSGVCGRVRSLATEGELSVRIAVWEEVGEGVCPDVARIETLSVALMRPLAGRSLEGEHGPASYPPFLVDHGATPNLVGFSPADATHAAALVGLRVRTRHVALRSGLARIVAQSPSPGSSLPDSRVIGIAVAGR